MRSYLSLIPISAKMRRRQNRMTLLCIVIAVFLVTAIFSVADMMVRTESDIMTQRHGSWHIKLNGITKRQAKKIAKRSDVVLIGGGAKFNEGGELPYRIDKKRMELYGVEENYVKCNSDRAIQGAFPKGDDEIMVGVHAAKVLGVQVGDSVTLHTPKGDRAFTVSGLGGVDENYYAGQYMLMDVYLPRTTFHSILKQNDVTDIEMEYYVQFDSAAAAADAIPELKKQFSLNEKNISENVAVLGTSGQSKADSMKNVYGMAAILFVLVLLAGVMMISGSMNSNVAQRTQFFGMMRCIGMSKRQVVCFVRLEALSWCKTAVPIGVILGTLVSWGICGVLHYGIGGEFITTPVFQLSPAGLLSGAVVGVVTVLLAAQSPARRAARVSPAAAVSGNSTQGTTRHRVWKHVGRLEWSLGIHHAMSSKKNWCLMTASFAFSIVLALCFSVLVQFVGLLLPSLCPWSPDISLSGYGNAQVLSSSVKKEIRRMPGVSAVWAATGVPNTPVSCPQRGVKRGVVCSYDDFMMGCSEEMLVEGTLADASGKSNQVMTIYNRSNPLKVGDTVRLHGTELTVVGAFSQGMFPDDVTIICPEKLFDRVMGKQKYNLMGILLDDSATDETVLIIAKQATDDIVVEDDRLSKQRNQATYLASRIVAYGFLGILGLISLFHIVNSISMSVSARTKQYGAMRAVGMDGSQLTKMIVAEAGTYAVSGLLAGFAIGLPLSRMLHVRLITRYFGVTWQIPMEMSAAVVVFVAAAAVLAVYAPAKRICHMPVTETINEL